MKVIHDIYYNTSNGYAEAGIFSGSESILTGNKVVVKDYDLFNRASKDVVKNAVTTTTSAAAKEYKEYAAENSAPKPDEASKKVLHNFKVLLTACGLEERFSNRLLGMAGTGLLKNGNINLDVFSNVLEQSADFGFGEYPEKIAFFGSSGVGKTTAMAKFALFAKTKLGKKTALITLDNYKISGARHLGRIGEVLKLPVYLVRSSKDLILTLRDLKRTDLILIDTIGCNVQEFDRVRPLSSWMDNYNALQSAKSALIKKVLLLPASSNVFDLRRMVQTFSELKLSGLGITKTDETCYFGPCLNTILQHTLPLNFVTSGQNMESGIETEKKELIKKVVNLLFQANNMQVN